MRFPLDKEAPDKPAPGWGIVPVHFGRDLMSELDEWCRVRGTTSILAVFTAYAALVLRWCKSSDGVVQYMSNSRLSDSVENTFGFFASPLHLRVQVGPQDSFLDLLQRVTEEYCDAYEHADLSYLEAQLPRPEYSRNTVFNWVPRLTKTGPSVLDGTEHVLTYSPLVFDLPFLKVLERDGEPLVVIYETEEGAVGGMYYPCDRISAESMERFVRNYLMFIRTLLRQPQRPIGELLLVA
jgi:hypothetical protein